MKIEPAYSAAAGGIFTVKEKAIPVIISGQQDLVGLAQTGTGKTAAYGLRLLQLIDFTSEEAKALILCPTRERCIQISRDLVRFSRYVKKWKIVAVYGGAGMVPQVRDKRKFKEGT